MMKVVIRADASSELGTGHAVRCLTLATSLRRFGAEVAFACQAQPGDMIAHVVAAGFAVLDPQQPLSCDADWLVVDHYALDRAYESPMRAQARKIFAIDDLANRSHDCDLLLDQNLYADMNERYRRLVPVRAKLLLGPGYALLRPEFVAARKRVQWRPKLKRLLVFFGGSDTTNETLKTLRALRRLQGSLAGVQTDVLIGRANVNGPQIVDYARSMRGVAVLNHTDNISELMLQAGLAIGAGGTTSWERCCLGLPALVIAVADNQVALSRALDDAGCQRYLGAHDHVSEEMLTAEVASAIDGYAQLRAMGERGRELVDGQGTDRVVAVLRSL